jgi:hypothetical protein
VFRHRGLALLVMGTSLVGVLSGLSGCGAPSTGNVLAQAVSPDQQYSQTVALEASWSIGYHDLKSLKAASAVVIEGTISAVARVTLDTATNIPYTDFTVSIDKVVFDPQGRVHGATTIVHQTGGIVNGTLYQVDDDPLFQIGERVVLFLHEYDPGKYYVVGGPTGRFEVRLGIVSAASTGGVALLPSTTIDAFLVQVHNA